MSGGNRECLACAGVDIRFLVSIDLEKKQQLRDYDLAYYAGSLEKIFGFENLRLQICTNCEHIQYEKQFSDEDLASMYEEHARLKKKRNGESLEKNRARLLTEHYMTKLLTSLQDHVGPNATLLDYGSGNGEWATVAKKLGFDVVAYEPFSVRVSCPVRHVSVWSEIEGEKFDVIICHQVLEHLPRPVVAVERFKTVAHDNTFVFVSVPNARKLSRKALVRHWPYDGKSSHILAPFQHLQGFSMKSLSALMTRHEFAVDFRAQVILGTLGWRRIVQLIIGRLWPRVGTTSLFFKKTVNPPR